MSYEDELCAEIAKLRKELEEARKVIEDGIDTIATHQYPMGESGAMVVNHTEAEQWSLRARAFLAAKETQG